MRVSKTELEDAFIIEPSVHGDERGFFFEGFSKTRLAEATGCKFEVAQVNHSRSTKHILRGLHYQVENVQAKLVWVTFGAIYDVIVDLRRSSSSFSHWQGFTLTAENKQRLLVQKALRTVLVLSQAAEITYVTSDIYNPEGERFLRWDCPKIGIEWPIKTPRLNHRDANAPGFDDCEKYR